MAMAQITLYPGRTTEQKRNLVKSVMKALVDDAGSSPENCYVVINEVDAPNWGVKGSYALDNPKTAAGYDADGNRP